jgi:hypothetical protein
MDKYATATTICRYICHITFLNNAVAVDNELKYMKTMSLIVAYINY